MNDREISVMILIRLYDNNNLQFDRNGIKKISCKYLYYIKPFNLKII